MIHVPDVAATVEWYRSVGFELISTNDDDGKPDWALLSFGEGQVMFNAGGAASTAPGAKSTSTSTPMTWKVFTTD